MRPLANVHASNRLNAICPYFTMFPLGFPHDILEEQSVPGDVVCDPFCGRGTTNYASRLVGLRSIGIDSSPVAVAISRAKLVNTTPDEIRKAAKEILDYVTIAEDIPDGEFWELAFEQSVLSSLCRLREGLLADCESDARIALKAIILGALHGPRSKTKDSYFSNQCQRTYAPKPNYAVRYWKHHNLYPPKVDVLQIIDERAQRFFGREFTVAQGEIIRGDSRRQEAWSTIRFLFNWVITSPPYYGMRTYFPDQWLRLWFVGGVSKVDYRSDTQLQHGSPTVFADELRRVWTNVGQRCVPHARLVTRFGGINDRKADARAILHESLLGTSWRTVKITDAGSAAPGRRQATQIRSSLAEPREEFDLWAEWMP